MDLLSKIGSYDFLVEPFHCDFSNHIFLGHLGNHLLNAADFHSNERGHIDKRYLKKCPHCGSENVDYMTRIIGYLKRVSNFSEARQKEAARRFYANGTNEVKD